MIQKLHTPIKFDDDLDWLIIARDGEKFFVAKSEDVKDYDSIDNDLLDIISTSLLTWAITVSYPLKKFVRLQKMLSEKFIGS